MISAQNLLRTNCFVQKSFYFSNMIFFSENFILKMEDSEEENESAGVQVVRQPIEQIVNSALDSSGIYSTLVDIKHVFKHFISISIYHHLYIYLLSIYIYMYYLYTYIYIYYLSEHIYIYYLSIHLLSIYLYLYNLCVRMS